MAGKKIQHFRGVWIKKCKKLTWIDESIKARVQLEDDDMVVSFDDEKSLLPSIPIQLALNALKNGLEKIGFSAETSKGYSILVD